MRKYVMLALVAIFTMSFAVNAQDQRPPRGERGFGMQMSAKERAARLATQLELTDAEKAKVEALFEKQDKKREEFKAEAKKLNEERGKLMEERKAEDEELQAIIGKENSYLLELEVDENDMVKVVLGQKIVVTLDSYKNQVFTVA